MGDLVKILTPFPLLLQTANTLTKIAKKNENVDKSKEIV